jgi:chromosomal replication initiator protein
MRLEIADTLPAAPRDLAKIGQERRKKLMGARPAPQFPRAVRLNPPRPITVLAAEVSLNNGQTGWTFGQYQFASVHRVRFDSGNVTVHEVARVTAGFFGLTLTDLQSEVRTNRLVYARHIAIYLARRLTTKSLPEIARVFGGRDHTTIMHAIEKIERLVKKDDSLRKDVEAIRAAFEGV